MWHVWGRRDINTGVLIGKRSGKTPLRRPDYSWKGNATADHKGTAGRTWTALIWLMIGTGGGLV
jgi:hypothetical protein